MFLVWNYGKRVYKFFFDRKSKIEKLPSEAIGDDDVMYNEEESLKRSARPDLAAAILIALLLRF